MCQPGDGRRWQEFYEGCGASAPSNTLARALALFEAERPAAGARLAIDLGCGAGRDTLELLKRGWRVLAIDNQPEAFDGLQLSVRPQWRARLECRVISFEEASLPGSDLVNASRSLPFCPPQHWDALWRRIVASLRSGGRFAGHFFGERDGWCGRTDMTFHAAARVEALLEGFDVEYFLEEEEEDGTTGRGREKHWHVLSVVARKV